MKNYNCFSCKNLLSHESFTASQLPKILAGRVAKCRSCASKAIALWRKNNPDQFRATRKKYASTEKAKEYKKKYRIIYNSRPGVREKNSIDGRKRYAEIKIKLARLEELEKLST